MKLRYISLTFALLSILTLLHPMVDAVESTSKIDVNNTKQQQPEPTISRVKVTQVGSEDDTDESMREAAEAGANTGDSKDFVIKENPVRSEKLKANKYNATEECKIFQDRMATYEALSEMRSNTLPELIIVDRCVDSLPRRCKEIYCK